ncbi:hypothetical protein M9434_001589 [Picochlorum sp. BPE23]|nr:hypothetical protein M9434_001589 [Picochlorum sp. BPE23]
MALRREASRWWWIILYCTYCLHLVCVRAQISDAIAKDGDMKVDASNKFLKREASSASNTKFTQKKFDTCPDSSIDLSIRWHTELSSSVHATPLITDLYNDGHKDILVPGLKQSVDLVSGRSGALDTGFEANHKSSMYSSPLLYDVDYDGVLDIMLPGYNGRIQFAKDTGADAIYGLIIPRLQVKRDWFEGLNLDPNDHSNPDVQAVEGDDSGMGERVVTRRARSLLAEQQQKSTKKATVEKRDRLTDEASQSFKDLFDDSDAADGEDGAWLDDPLENTDVDYDDVKTGENDGKDTEKKQETDTGHFTDDYFLDYDAQYHINSEMWEDDLHATGRHGADEVKSPYVWIDPHIQTTPVIGDIDGDDREELVLAVSYFFDPGEYSADSSMAKFAVGENGDIQKYLASGIVVYDLSSRIVKWSQHLDLSTAYTRYKAAALSSPAIGDVNGDGLLEVIVGTSMGFLYVLDAKTGNALDGWPIQMGDIQGHVAVADIDQDGKLEIIATDTRGSIAAFRGDGTEVWESHVGSAFTAGVTFGDVDGDGQLEGAFGTTDGRVYLVDAATGVTKKGFPFRTFGKISAPVLITKVDNADKNAAMQLVLTSHDGYLYVIDPVSLCTSALNIGEPSNSMVLAEDVSSTGTIDLIVATTGGNLYSIRTTSKYHPLKTRSALLPGVSEASYVAPWNWVGIYAVAGTRIPRDVRGSHVQIRFTVMDKRALSHSKKVNDKVVPAKLSYKIIATLVGVGAKEMNAGDHPVIGLSQTVNTTGTYMMDLPCPRSRTTATIRLEMKDDNGSIYVDEFALSFHVHFYRLLKWLVVGPLSIMAAVVIAFLGDQKVHLPS